MRRIWEKSVFFFKKKWFLLFCNFFLNFFLLFSVNLESAWAKRWKIYCFCCCYWEEFDIFWHNMSAIVCGKRNNFFEDLQSPSSSPSPAPKRIRRSPPRSAAVNCFYTPLAIDHLVSIFPDMDKQVSFFFFFYVFYCLIVIILLEFYVCFGSLSWLNWK